MLEKAPASTRGPTAARRRRSAIDRPEPAPRGRTARAVAHGDVTRDVAWVETLLAAATDGAVDPTAQGRRPRPTRRHLRRWLRTRRPGHLVLFVVDASGSMGPELVAVARRMALEVLERAYVHRDRVAVIAFREERAELVLPPSRGAELAHRKLGDLGFGGTTPLAAALVLARRVIAGRPHEGDDGRVIVISDGRGNVGGRPGQRAVRREIEQAARALGAAATAGCVLLDATAEGDDDRPARRLADALGAERVALWSLPAAGASARVTGR